MPGSQAQVNADGTFTLKGDAMPWRLQANGPGLLKIGGLGSSTHQRPMTCRARGEACESW